MRLIGLFDEIIHRKNGIIQYDSMNMIPSPILLLSNSSWIQSLHVRDETGQIPLLVKNKTAEILFGGISAENVYKCYLEEKNNKVLPHACDENPLSCSLQTENQRNKRALNFYRIFLIMMKLLMHEDNNSPFLFEIIVDVDQICKFELVSLTMPCCT